MAARFWDGSEWHDGATSPRCTTVLKQPSAVRAIVASRDDTGPGEAYLGDLLDIEAAVAFGARLRRHGWSRRERLRMAWRARASARPGWRSAAASRFATIVSSIGLPGLPLTRADWYA